MPAERSRGSRRTDADGTQLVWTEPALAPGIAFATNLTPGAFEDSKQQSTPDLTFAPPTIAPPADTKLALPPTPTPTSFFFFDAPAPDETKPKRASHKRKPTPPPAPSSPSSADSPSSDSADGATPAPAPHIPRPPNAFILFRSSFIRARAVPAHIEPSHAALSAIAGLTWAALPAPEKERWHSKAKEERERHRERFPGYAFRPRGRAKGSTSTTSTPAVKDTGTSATDDEGGGGGEEKESKGKPTPPRRRQQRECPPLDRVRQAHIASLILSGLSGAQLQEATAQFDLERRARGEGGMEVRWGGVETPEGRVAAGEKKILEQETAATEKTEGSPSVAVRRRTTSKAEKRRPSATAKRPRVMSSPTFPSPSSVPTTPTDATSPFAFAFDAMSLPTTPINTTTFEWPYASSPSPSSPSSPFDFESYPSSPCTPFDSYPPSPALSHSSAVSHSSVSPSTWGSLEDLSQSLSLDLPGLSPLSACSSMSSIGGDLSSLNALNSLNADCAIMPVDFSMSMSMYETSGCELMSPFELDLDFGLGLGMDAGVQMGYLTDYMEGTQTQAQGVAW